MDTTPAKESFLVQVLMNEKEVSLEQCNHQLFCPYDVFKSIFSDRISKCNLSEMCAIKPDSSAPSRKISPPSRDSTLHGSDLSGLKFFATLIIGAIVGFGFAVQLPSRDSVYVNQPPPADQVGRRKQSLHGVEEHVSDSSESADSKDSNSTSER
jgi:hypothetical protein